MQSHSVSCAASDALKKAGLERSPLCPEYLFQKCKICTVKTDVPDDPDDR
jgi:hypothetical protein